MSHQRLTAVTRKEHTRLVGGLKSVGGDVEAALERVNVPSYVLDKHGIIRWVNRAGRQLVGDVRGRQFTSVVAPEDTRRAREEFASRIAGVPRHQDHEIVLVGNGGNRVGVEISSVPLLEDGHVVGVFGQIMEVEDEEPPEPHPHLTPRQTEVLRLLDRGHSTRQIADELHLSTETVRNHIRGILRALDVHTRLEAVAVSRNAHFVPV
jgi:PAS domain S-box-containing protein